MPTNAGKALKPTTTELKNTEQPPEPITAHSPATCTGCTADVQGLPSKDNPDAVPNLESMLPGEGSIGNLDLGDIIDAPAIQSLVDDFYKLSGMPMGLIDIKGKVLAGVGWQDVCTKFHRNNPETCRNCIESDIRLSAGVPLGDYKIYKCKNNMWDVATPVMVGDRHLGNLFIGQFFFDDEPLDYELFRSQARRYGFDETEYIAAIEAAPRMSKKALDTGMSFYMKLADIISKLSYSNIKLGQSLKERATLMESLRRSEEHFRNMFERHKAVMLLVEPETGKIVAANTAAADFYRRSLEDLHGMNIQEINQQPSDDTAILMQEILCGQRNQFKTLHKLANGEVRWVDVYSTPIETQGKTMLFSIIHDITKRMQAEEGLRKSEERFRVAQELSLDAFTILTAVRDEHGSITDFRWEYVNPEAGRLLKHPPEELINRQLLEILPGNNARSDLFNRYASVVETGQPHDYELYYQSEDIDGWFRNMAVKLGDGVAVCFSDITERKQAEKSLLLQSAELATAHDEAEHEKQRLEAVMEALPIGVAILDAHGGNIRSNSAFKLIWGGPPATHSVEDYSAYKAWWTDTGKPVEPDEWASAIALRKGETTAGQLMRILKFDGAEAFIINSASPVRDVEGNITGCAVAIQDITEFKRAEEALRESEARLRSHMENTPMAVIEWDKDFIVTRWSGEATRIFGWSSEEAIGKHIADLNLIFEDDLHIVARTITQLTDGVTRQVVSTNRNYTKTGAVRHCTWYNSVLIGRDERMSSVLSLVLDITDRKRAEDCLDLQAETASWLLASDSPQQIVDLLCKKVMKFLDCHTFFNFLVDEKEGRLHLNACAGIPEEEKQKIEWLDYGVAVCGCAARDACRIVAEDIPNSPDPRTELVKSYGIQAYGCHPLMVQDRVLGTLSFGSRSRASFSSDDLALMKAVADLVAIAMERKLAEEELRRAKDAAEAANRTKSQFLANMSHELRTPMTGVLGMLDLALAGQIDAKQREYIGTARKSAGSLLRILNDILELTKIEAGKFSMENKPFSLQECLSGAMEILIPEARRRGLLLSFTIADDVPPIVVGDHLRLRQVLTNLAGNAVKFCEQGKIELLVKTREKSANGKIDLIFSVTDTGIGIPDDKKELLFKPFSQVDESDTRRYGGTGLGLAISKEIVERMGGTITCESQEGIGSTFTFSIPMEEAPAERLTELAQAPSQSTESIAANSGETKRARLLLAEDDHVIRHILGEMLKLSNYDLEIAENGRKAVDMWRTGGYDLILMDVQMPFMDGFAATRAIREEELAHGLGHTLIVAMTAHAAMGDEQRCIDAGMDAYVSKPIDLKASIALIGELIRQRNN